MTFTAKPESGYTGSFSKTFKITEAKPDTLNASDGTATLIKLAVTQDAATEKFSIEKKTPYTPTKNSDPAAAYTLKGDVPYSREGVKPIDKITLTNSVTNTELKAGTDYTVSYANNTKVTETGTDKIPAMTIKLKGNYKGSIAVYFTIAKADLKTAYENGTVQVTAAQVGFDGKKADTYQYTPKVTVTDGKKTLKKDKDYTLVYKNNTQEKVKAYLEALAEAGKGTGSITTETLNQLKEKQPSVTITAAGTDYYTAKTDDNDGSVTVYLQVYKTKLTTSNLYVAVSDETEKVTYTGSQVKPDVTVYYGDAATVKAVQQEVQAAEKKKSPMTYEAVKKLAAEKGLTPLSEIKSDALAAGGTLSGYTLSYGANVAAGKNKGTVTVTGTGIYGGGVTAKFNINQRAVY
jgi:hypothetical protein